jgi:3-hydroxybutyryl-CoA dehydrogenase
MSHRVVVVGAGTMGNGIAQVFASSGHTVFLCDVDRGRVDAGIANVKNSLGRFVKKEKMSQADADAIVARIEPHTTFACAKKATFAVEAATENRDIKAKIFRDLDANLPPEAILATNTSSISITWIAAQTKRADRVIGMHFMNPVPLMKLVEIIRGLQTSDATHATTMALSQQLGKIPHTANDAAGFVANRILMPMINESIFALAENVGTREAIDEIMKLGCAFPMGPLTLADFIGLDVCLAIMEVLHNELGDSKYRPAPLLRQMVDAGWLGRKSGRGFYDYSADSSK